MKFRIRPGGPAGRGFPARVVLCLLYAAAWGGAPRVSGEPAANQPAETQPVAGTRPASTQPVTTTQAAQSKPAEPPKPKLVPLSFNNAGMNDVARFLTDQLGKPVIISKEVSSIRVTLVNPRQLPKEEALSVLATALQEVGVAIEEREKTVHLIPIAQVAQSQLQTVGAEVDLKTLTPISRIIRKVFVVRQTDPARLVEVVKPLLPSYGVVTADPATGKLIVVATVERLMVIEGIVRELDVPGMGGGELRVFTVRNVDVLEIVPLLEKLISGYIGAEVKAVTATPAGAGGRPGGPVRMSGPGGPSGPGGAPSPPGGAGGVVIKGEKPAVLLIPEPRRSAIVVAAPANVLAQIDLWLVHLDQPKPPSTQNEIIEVQYIDAGELVGQLTTMLNSIPDDSLRNAMRIFPFASSRKVMLIGSEQNRKIVKEWIKEIDIADTGIRVTETFTLKNADAQQVVENIKELFQEQQRRSYYYFDYYDTRRGTGEDRTKVTVTANTRNNSVTVVASPEKMARIREQIEEWDMPLEGEQAAPRIFDLKYVDPDKTKTLLESLFTKKEQNDSFRRWFFYDDEPSSTASPVGRLFGQFRFEAYPDTGKLIVVSKNEENYRVIEEMIAKIDRPQTAGLPRIIQLKFADAETLAEQLNALLNAPGTPTSILRRSQLGTFEDLGSNESPFRTGDQSNARPDNNRQQGQQNTGVMQFWWQSPPSEMIKTRQPSNLVGKLRIVPNVEQNLLMVAAPEEYVESIERFVAELDRPGQQVLIKAVIAEVTLEDAMSLGYRFSTDPTAFITGDPLITENALRGLFTYSFEDLHDNRHTFTFDMDVNNLLSLLRRVTDLKIKSEPKVFTADNVEAEFFDGQDIPFISNSFVSGTTGQSQSFEYKPVGIRLRVRPHITKERNIDLTVNLLVSSIIPGRTLFGGAIVDRRETTTRIVLEDGKTFLISGILREEDRKIIRGIPGLQDIPLIGEIFKHRETAKVNTEVLIFLTPYVIGSQDSHEVIEAEPLERLRRNFPPPVEQECGSTDPGGEPWPEPESDAHERVEVNREIEVRGEK